MQSKHLDNKIGSPLQLKPTRVVPTPIITGLNSFKVGCDFFILSCSSKVL